CMASLAAGLCRSARNREPRIIAQRLSSPGRLVVAAKHDWIALEGIAILLGEPEARVLFVSNSQARAAAALLLPSYASVCFDGDPRRANLSVLKDRNVDIWPVGGEAGAGQAAELASRIVRVAAR